MSRTLLVGGAGWGNVGDDLIADRICRRTAGTIVVAGGPRRTSLPDGVRQIQTRDRVRLLWEIARADRVLIGGGGLFDDRMPNFYRPFLRVAKAARLAHTPFELVAIGVGPIQRPGTAEAYRWLFEHADRASVRDIASRERAASTGARRLPKVEPDPALSQPPAPTVELEPHDLIVNVRTWEWGELIEQPGVKVTSDIVEAVAEAVNCLYGPQHRVALVSMSTNPADDDSAPLEALAGRLRCQVSRFYAGDLPTVEAVVASARMVLSMRLHLALLAVLYRTPVAGIAYDEKIAQQGAMHGFPSVPLDEDFSAEAVRRVLSSGVSSDP